MPSALACGSLKFRARQMERQRGHRLGLVCLCVIRSAQRRSRAQLFEVSNPPQSKECGLLSTVSAKLPSGEISSEPGEVRYSRRACLGTV